MKQLIICAALGIVMGINYSNATSSQEQNRVNEFEGLYGSAQLPKFQDLNDVVDAGTQLIALARYICAVSSDREDYFRALTLARFNNGRKFESLGLDKICPMEVWHAFCVLATGDEKNSTSCLDKTRILCNQLNDAKTNVGLVYQFFIEPYIKSSGLEEYSDWSKTEVRNRIEPVEG